MKMMKFAVGLWWVVALGYFLEAVGVIPTNGGSPWVYAGAAWGGLFAGVYLRKVAILEGHW